MNVRSVRDLRLASRRILATSLISILPGCAGRMPPINAISVDRIADVEGEAKRQLSVYQSAVNLLRAHPEIDAEAKCGKGDIDFDVTSIKLDLATTLDTTDSASLGLTIPVANAGTIGPSVSKSHEVTDSEELVVPLYPVLDPHFSAQDTKPAPISQALLALRAALILGAQREAVCVYDYDYRNPSSDAGGTYTLGLSVVNDPKVGVEIKLAVVDLNLSHERKSTTGNTLTVTFHQRKLPASPLPLNGDGVPIDPHGQAIPQTKPS